jgi:hypothetical protein
LTPDDGAWNALYCTVHRRWLEPFDEHYAQDRWRIAGVVAADAVTATCTEEKGAQSDVLRDIFGNPYRPSTAASAWLTWDGGTVPKLAAAIHDERAFGRLPVLADALEDAGCTDAELLAHCRSGGAHVRGCWAVDWILGKH